MTWLPITFICLLPLATFGLGFYIGKKAMTGNAIQSIRRWRKE